MNNRFLHTVAAGACALLTSWPAADANAVSFNIFGVGAVEIFSEDTGDSVGQVELGIDVSFDIDPGAPETSLNNFAGAVTNPSVTVDVLGVLIDDGEDVPNLDAFPYFTDLSGLTSDGGPNDIGDAFVGMGELGINFPTFDGIGAVPLSPEPLSVNLLFIDTILDGDLSGVLSSLIAATDPLELINDVDSSITFQSDLGEAFTDDIFFQIAGLSVVPEPSSLLLLAAGSLCLGVSSRRGKR